MLKMAAIGATAGVLAVIAAWSSPAAAKDSLIVAGFGGSFEKVVRNRIIPIFEKDGSVQITYVAGNSTDTLAKLKAQKGNEQIDVAFIDDGPMTQAVSLGVCAPITGVDFKEIYDTAAFPDHKASGFGLFATGLVYNTKFFREHGWPAPTSWNDLKNAKFKGKVVIPPVSNGYGMLTLVMMARLNGGDEKNTDPGFKAMLNEVGPNVLVYEASPAKLSELLQTGQAVLGVWGSGRAQALAESGFPVEFVYPKEGSPVSMAAICPIAKKPTSASAQAFVKLILSKAVQEILADEIGFAPVRRDVVVKKPGSMPYGENARNLVTMDWDAINREWLGEWTKRWNREIER